MAVLCEIESPQKKVEAQILKCILETLRQPRMQPKTRECRLSWYLLGTSVSYTLIGRDLEMVPLDRSGNSHLEKLKKKKKTAQENTVSGRS